MQYLKLFVCQLYLQKVLIFITFYFCYFVLPDKLPNGVTYHTGTYQDRLAKLQDHLRQLSILFRKLRLVYDKCNENCGGMDPIPVEASSSGQGRVNVRHKMVSGVCHCRPSHFLLFLQYLQILNYISFTFDQRR